MSVQVLSGGGLLVVGEFVVNGVSGVLLRVAGLPSGGVRLLFSFPSGEVRGFLLTPRQAIEIAYAVSRASGEPRRVLKRRDKKRLQRRRAKLRGAG